jgi:hypothetical protein
MERPVEASFLADTTALLERTPRVVRALLEGLPDRWLATFAPYWVRAAKGLRLEVPQRRAGRSTTATPTIATSAPTTVSHPGNGTDGNGVDVSDRGSGRSVGACAVAVGA